jgi:hypothetical protein
MADWPVAVRSDLLEQAPEIDADEEERGHDRGQRQEEEEYGTELSPVLSFSYDEFAAKVVAAENKKKSERKLKRLTN